MDQRANPEGVLRSSVRTWLSYIHLMDLTHAVNGSNVSNVVRRRKDSWQTLDDDILPL